MSFLENALSAIINGKSTVNKPIFIKDFNQENEQLKDLMELSKKIISGKKEFIYSNVMSP